MKRFLAPILLVTLLLPSLALGLEIDDLVLREGLWYEKFTDVPFSGKVTGKTQGELKDGKRDGLWVRYWDNGQLRDKDTFKDGERDGPMVWFHDNGQLGLKGTYKDGNRDGPWVAFHEDGTVWKEYTVTFKDGVRVE